MPSYDEEYLLKLFSNMTPEERQKAQEVIVQVDKRDESMQQLDSHPLVEAVHTAIQNAADETGTSTDTIRLVEIRRNVKDLAAFELSVTKLTEAWKKNNATHRNPNNPAETWCSPEGKGNPPKWVREAIGKKPDPKKDPERHKKWQEDLSQFAIEPNGEDKAE